MEPRHGLAVIIVWEVTLTTIELISVRKHLISLAVSHSLLHFPTKTPIKHE